MKLFKCFMNSQIIKSIALFFCLGTAVLSVYFGSQQQINAEARESFDTVSDTIAGNVSTRLDSPTTNRNFGDLPLFFVANQGQTDSKVFYYSAGSGYNMFLTPSGATLQLSTKNNRVETAGEPKDLRSSSVNLSFVGADLSEPPVAEDILPGKANYFVGSDQSKWQKEVSTYAKVRYKKIYDGIDVVFHGDQRELEYDFVVAPHADFRKIALSFEGAEKVSINKRGDLVMKLSNGSIVNRKPIAFQKINGKVKEVAVKFIKQGSDVVKFKVGKYDRNYELTIDPVIIFSTFFGGNNNDVSTSVKTDVQGNIYLTGATASTNFPVFNPLQPNIGAEFFFDAFVTKINPAGNAVLYSTYLGGNSEDYASSISVDNDGNALIAGRTYSTNFPTLNAAQNQLNGIADGFVTKLNANGSALMFSTYLGGAAFDNISGMALSNNGEAVVVGQTESNDFPTIAPYQSAKLGASIFSSSDSGISWTTRRISNEVSIVYSYAVVPTSPNIVFAGTNRGVFRSLDGGGSWRAVGRGDLSTIVTKITAAASNPNVLYAVSNNTVFRSVNGGENWTNIQTNIFISTNAVAVDPLNADTVYIGGAGGTIYKTINGGGTWTSISIIGVSATVNSLLIDPANSQIVYAGSSQQIYKSTISGGNWVAVMSGIPLLTTFWDLLFDSSGNAIYAATQNGIYKTVNGGTNWTSVNISNQTGIRSLAKDPNNPSNFYAATFGGSFLRSSDNGLTWSISNTGLTGNSLLSVAATSNQILLGGNSGTEAFVAKFNSNGTQVNYSTFLGGNFNDSATAVKIGGNGKINVTGVTNSINFPVFNAFQPNSGGGNDVFLVQFNQTGTTLDYSTYLGGSANDAGAAIAIDNNGNTYLTGSTTSTNFPLQNAFQATCGSCGSFVNDAFVTKFNPAGSGLVFSSFLGGASADNGLGIEVDSQGRAIVVGSTNSTNFPLLDPVQQTYGGTGDGFISQIRADGTNFVYSTYYGGSSSDSVNGVALSPEGNAVLVGLTNSANFRVLQPVQSIKGAGQDAFIAKIGIAADLEIVINDERDPVMVNNNLTYRLRVKNNGPLNASDVTVINNLPAGANFVSASPTQGSCQRVNAVLTCTLGELAVNAQAEIVLVLVPTQTGNFTNSASVRANEPDPVVSDNSAAENTLITGLPSIAGRIANSNGEAANAVTLKVEGFQNRTTQTGTTGNYQISELPVGGNYSVRPEKNGFYFSPRSKNFNSLTADETANFVVNACTYTLSATTVNTSAAGGTQVVTITANDPFCSWTAVSNQPWLNITSGSSGFGNGTVRFTVQQSDTARTGTLTIAGQTFTVNQTGCSFTLQPMQQSFGQNGGTGTVSIAASQSFCQWNAASNIPWLTITGSSSGNGNAVLNYSVAPSSSPRNGRIVINGQTFPVFQEFNVCPSPQFGPPIESIINARSTDIVTADFNRDGRPDAATLDVTPSQTSTLSVYIGNGNGTFNRNTFASPIFTLDTLTTGDYNNDGFVDIVIVGSGKFVVYNGNGNGGFTLLGSFDSTTSSNSKVFTEDFNHDGNLDLLVGVSNGLYLHKGIGNGTFSPVVVFPITGRFTYSFAVGDFNGDGEKDVVVGQELDFSVPRLIYFSGSSNGAFTQSGVISTETITPFTVKAADLNGDGKADIITNGFGGSQVQVFLRDANNQEFRPPIKVFTEPFAANEFDAADVNNDGKPDIVSAGSQTFPQRLNVMRGNGNGTFRTPLGYASTGSVNNIAFADFNSDGRTDVAFAKETNQMAVQLSQCSSSTANRSGTTQFDFDGDRKADFAVLNPTSNLWSIYRGAKQPAVSTNFGAAGDILTPADYDGDGRTDVAVFRPSDGVWYRLNSSDGSFSAQQWGQANDIPVPGDYDGDDRADLAVFRPENKVWYWIGSLDGQIHSIEFGLSTDLPAVGDYDGDSISDIAVFRPSSGYWYWLNSSNGAFNSINFGVNTDKIVPADYDGDGKTDVAVYRNGMWYISGSTQGFKAVNFGLAADLPVPADYNGDGIADIAVYRNGNWYILQNTGNLSTTIFGSGGDKPIPNLFIR
jgi:uncharacterized repeat protein (TIGR01451 family)